MIEKSTITPELKVLNLKASLEFYVTMAGFEVLYDRPENNFAMLRIKNSRLMLEELKDDSRAHNVGALEKPFGRGMHFQIAATDIQKLYQKFKEVNYSFFNDMEEKWYRVDDIETGHLQFWVQDPDGYLLRFFETIGTRTAIK